uniref:Uncharacterized protein n=1 Tax=Romanomermis culicivorax TaxID=13658 RepID=A0A915JP26_ROMCU
MLVPTEQVKKMSFQWIGIFPNKVEGSPPQTGFLKPICPLGDSGDLNLTIGPKLDKTGGNQWN